MLTVRIQEKNHSESIMVLKLKDGTAKKSKMTAKYSCKTRLYGYLEKAAFGAAFFVFFSVQNELTSLFIYDRLV